MSEFKYKQFTYIGNNVWVNKNIDDHKYQPKNTRRLLAWLADSEKAEIDQARDNIKDYLNQIKTLQDRIAYSRQRINKAKLGTAGERNLIQRVIERFNNK